MKPPQELLLPSQCPDFNLTIYVQEPKLGLLAREVMNKCAPLVQPGAIFAGRQHDLLCVVHDRVYGYLDEVLWLENRNGPVALVVRPDILNYIASFLVQEPQHVIH